MGRRLVGLLLPGLVSGCSGATTAGSAAPQGTATASTTSAVVAAPPRKLTGTGVVLALRQATSVEGTEWAWLMPEGRVVTLAPTSAPGERVILAPNFFAGPNGALVGLDPSGGFVLAADDLLTPLGRFDDVAFDARASSVLAWSASEWAVFSRAGARLSEGAITKARPLLLSSGLLVEYPPRVMLTRVGRPPAAPHLSVPLVCNDVFAGADTLVCFDGAIHKRTTSAFSLSSGAELARFPDSTTGQAPKPTFAVRADGKVMASVLEKVELSELSAGKTRARPRVIFRRTEENARWRAPGRVGFTMDGKHLCIEELVQMRVLDTSSEWKNAGTAAKASGERELCLFAPRGEDGGGPSARPLREWDAVLARVPAREGFEAGPRRSGGWPHGESEEISLDRKTGAFVEQKRIGEGDRERWLGQAVVFEVATGAVKRVIPLSDMIGARWSTQSVPEVELSEDGGRLRLCAPLLLPETCRTYETATGELSAPTAWRKPGPRRTELHTWKGTWPEARVLEAMAALGVVKLGEATVTSWKDEGTYLSVEMDLGKGGPVHLNVPDAESRVPREIRAIANGSMLGIAHTGTVELWSVEPVVPRAVLVMVDGGVAALFGDGSIEASGAAEGALACQQGERVVPIERCGDVRAEKGTLAAMVKSASKR